MSELSKHYIYNKLSKHYIYNIYRIKIYRKKMMDKIIKFDLVKLLKRINESGVPLSCKN